MVIQKEIENFSFPIINKSRKDREEFIVDLTKTCNLVNKLFRKAVVANFEKSINKLQQGILLGHMVRIHKLYDDFLYLICESKNIASILIVRTITETAIILRYLIQNFNDELYQKFIKSSLSYDKKLYDIFQSNMKDREPLSYEKRVIESIKNTFKKIVIKLKILSFQSIKNGIKIFLPSHMK